MKSNLRTPSQSINLLPKQRLNLLLLFQFRLKKSNFRSRFVQLSIEPRHFSLQGPALIAGSIAETLIAFFGLRHCNEGVDPILEIFLEYPNLLFLYNNGAKETAKYLLDGAYNQNNTQPIMKRLIQYPHLQNPSDEYFPTAVPQPFFLSAPCFLSEAVLAICRLPPSY